ncbi:MAG: ATP-binding cassette domain-containing protein [Proteobacteria bacterium]|nr:ATP-binding cassette domain-containing protein [Pseudomonadota bacterium]
MININNLCKSFDNRKVLENISFSVVKGECVFVLGKSGVGKSVLLKNIVGLVLPESGTITVDELKVDSQRPEELSLIRQRCGLVFQFPALLDSVTVFENICFGLRARGLLTSQVEIEARVKEKLKLVGLSEIVLNQMPTELSFGAQKRVSIARTLAVEPEYLLFDEPTTGMDPIATAGLNQLIKNLTVKLQVTSIVVSHDIKSALAVGTRIILLEEGGIVFDGKPEAFKTCSITLAQEFQMGFDYHA